MLVCKEVVELLSSGVELPWAKRTKLRLHLMMCKHCGTYEQELNIMQRSFRKLFANLTKITPEEIRELEKKVKAQLFKNNG